MASSTTSTLDDGRNLKALLDHIGIGQSGSDQSTLMELMNFTLQCLGGIRLMVVNGEKERVAVRAANGRAKEDESVDEVIRDVFANAVERMISSIVRAKDLHDLDPSRHLIESFPHDAAMGSQHWLPVHWTILGDTEFQPPVQTNRMNGQDNSNSSSIRPADGSNAPELAVISQRLKNIEKIVKAFPASVNEFDREGRSVLHYACRLSSPALVEGLMKYSSPDGFGPHVANRNGAFPLHNVARFSKSREVTETMLRISPEIVRLGNIEGTLPLHWAAAKNRNLEIIETLKNAYPDAIRLPNHEGYLPLHSAGQNTDLSVVKAIHRGFPGAISVRDAEGGVPLHHACCFNTNLEVIKFMYDAYPEGIRIVQGNGLTPLHLASSQNNSPAVMKYLLDIYPEAARKADSDGWLPLHCLMNFHRDDMTANRIECLRLMLKSNPTAVRATRNDGETPYSMARAAGHRALIKRLLLLADPTVDAEGLADLNWHSERRFAVLAIAAMNSGRVDQRANNSIIDGNSNSNGNSNSTGNGNRNGNGAGRDIVYLLRRLSNTSAGTSGFAINSHLFQYVVKFL